MKIQRRIIITNFSKRITFSELSKRADRRKSRYGFPVLIWELTRIKNKYVWLLSNCNSNIAANDARAINVDKARNSIKNNGLKIIYKKLPRNYFKDNKCLTLNNSYLPFSEKDLH